MKIDYKKIKNWLINNSKIIYRITAIVLLAILSYGLYITFRQIIIKFNPVNFYYVHMDKYLLHIFYTLTFILIIQFLFVLILGKVKRIAKLCCSIIILNMIAMLITFILIFIFNFIAYYSDYPAEGYIHELLIRLLWPASIWASHDWIYSIAFAILASGISTTLQYYFLRKNTKSKKLLLTSLIISSVIVYTCITIFFNIRY